MSPRASGEIRAAEPANFKPQLANRGCEVPAEVKVWRGGTLKKNLTPASVKDGAEMNLREPNNQASPSKTVKSIISPDVTVLGRADFPIPLRLRSNQTNINMAATNRPVSDEEKSLYLITDAGWNRLH